MKLNFKKLGEGQPLIILHGLFGSLDNWMTLAKKWASDFEVYLVDQRNHGQSPHDSAFNYSLMAEDLKELIEQEGIKNPIVLGHSMGGKTAMEFAVNYPEKLAKLIVVDIAPVKYQVHHYTIIDALSSIDLAELKGRKEADLKLAEKIEEFGVRQFLLKNLYWKEKEQLAWRFNLEVLAKEIIPISEFSISPKRFEKPTLFIKGERSDYIKEEHRGKIEEKFPQYSLKTIEGAGHWVHAEKAKEFAEQINTFIN